MAVAVHNNSLSPSLCCLPRFAFSDRALGFKLPSLFVFDEVIFALWLKASWSTLVS